VNWKIKLLLASIDVSANLINTLRIEAEEGTAKIAEFSLIPHAGPISVTKWVGKSVILSYQQQSDSSEFSEHILFNGIVDEPLYDPTTKITTFICSDQLQDKIQKLNRSEINTLMNGHWSHVVFDHTYDNWQYTQDLLSTLPKSLDLDNTNNFQLTLWQAKEAPDFIFTEDNILYQSIEVQLANRREIHNQANILVQYRYQRLKQREIHFGYQYPLSFCEQNFRNSTLPNVDMIQQAISGTGWHLKGNVQYSHQPASGWMKCPHSHFGWLIREEMRKFLVRDAMFTLSKRFIQTVTENYQLRVNAPQSINQFGEILHQENITVEIAQDTDKFSNIEKYQSAYSKSVIDSNGDYVIEAEDRAQLNQGVITKLNQAKTAILKSHRNNLITFKTPLHPVIERHHTVKLDTLNVKAQGKVKHIIHECDFNQGSSQSTITIAISRTDDEMEVCDIPLIPPNKINQLGEEGLQINIALPTYLGGKKVSLEYNDTWDGYSGNERSERGGKIYPEKFSITVPGVEEAQSPINYHLNNQYEISIPNELLLLSA